MMIKQILQNLIEQKKHQIDGWFEAQYQNTTPMIYSSVDIRHSGHKIVPVDTNLFPAGFNNLNENSSNLASNYLKKHLKPQKKILVVTEAHTRNLHYLDNLIAIINILKNANFEAELINFDIEETINLVSASRGALTIKKLNKVESDDLIILNNDLTNGIPEQLKNIPNLILPDINLGWHQRRKSNVFAKYNHIAEKFCQDFKIDPFFITSMFENQQNVNFKDSNSLGELAIKVDQILSTLKEKYQKHSIQDQPYVFIKSDMGTYGMGIMTARGGEEILKMNKSAKNKMATIKSGVVNNEIIIQEGIHTIDQHQGFPAEKMLYLIAGKKVAEINRFNEAKDTYANLNSRGMKFEINPDGNYNAYTLIAELASLSACFELD